MKSLFRKILKLLLQFYPVEYGKYTILEKIYFPFLAPSQPKNVISSIRAGIKMNLDIREYIQSTLYLFGHYELPLMKYIEKNVKESQVVFDIGANVGFLTLTFSKQAKKNGKVYAFEPEPKNFKKLQENVLLNNFQNISLNNFAISSINDKLKLYLSDDNNFGTHSLVNERNNSENYVNVDTVKLDDFVFQNNIKKIDWMKIDVEGAELDVVNGAKKTLIDLKPNLIIEVISENMKKRGLSSVLFKKMMLDEFAYFPFLINNSGKLLEDSADNENNSENLVFIHKSNLKK
ncbi:MAG: FkbM family methyltransferase [Ignavibacteria bacterium]|nr:FkbM family methyltransferase [Ignavibacteria bacterium]